MKIGRRGFLRGAGLGMAALGLGRTVPGVSAARRDKPNIVLMLLDDVGYNVFAPYGGVAFDTPNVNRLAETGMVFTQCHARAMCAPTRQVLTTGKHLGRGGVNDVKPYIAQVIKGGGYATGISGKWMMGRMEPWARGFDEGVVQVNGFRFWSPQVVVFNSGGYLKEHNLKNLESRTKDYDWPIDGTQPGAVQLRGQFGPEAACDYVCDFIERHKDEPFFLYYPMKLGHVPIVPTPLTKMSEEVENIINGMTDDTPENQGKYGNRDKYEADVVEYIDLVLGRVLETLKDCGLRENTLLIFTSDNGPGVQGRVAEGKAMLPGAKGGALDAASRVPCIANWPGVVPAGARCDDLVDFTDFLPTFAEMAGVDLAAFGSFDGQSFLPQLRGEEGNPREYIYFHGGPHPVAWKKVIDERVDYEEPKPWQCRFVRGKRYKLYGDGRFYDLEQDIEEWHPIKPGTGGAEGEAIRARFQAVLDRGAKESVKYQPDPVYEYK